ncbi:MAG: hypothetical protein HFE63_01555 [Clostridiales bacterium]|nr:hypothetical protein [Clostridiales bacterium]
MKILTKAIKLLTITAVAALPLPTGTAASDRIAVFDHIADEYTKTSCPCCSCIHENTVIAEFPKEDVPSLTLKVTELNDSTLSEPIWQDSADYDFGDTISLRMTSIVPDGSNSSNYVFNLQLPTGLTAPTVNVNIDEIALDQNKYTVSNSDILQIEIEDISELAASQSTITVDCSVQLDSSAVCGGEGNIVLAWLEYGSDGERTVTDKAAIFTHELNLPDAGIHVDTSSENLSLHKYIAARGEYVPCGTAGSIISGLDSGKYKLCSADRELEFELFAELDTESDDPKLSSLIVQIIDEHPTAPIINNNVELPFAGGHSAGLYYIAGAAMISAALIIFLFARKRQNK